MTTFAELRRAKELGFNLTTLLVKAYLDEHGPMPAGLVATACQTSVRSVERALATLKAAGLLFDQPTSKMTHDHVSDLQRSKRTAPQPAAPAASDVASAAAASADPLAKALLEAEVLPWCVDVLLAKVDREVLESQLIYHRHRLETGFTFKAHPAKFLFRACLNNYPAPAGYFERRNRPEAQAPARAAARPVEAPAAELTREGALTVVRMGLRSRLPALREEAQRLAAHFGIDTAGMVSLSHA